MTHDPSKVSIVIGDAPISDGFVSGRSFNLMRSDKWVHIVPGSVGDEAMTHARDNAITVAIDGEPGWSIIDRNAHPGGDVIVFTLRPPPKTTTPKV